LSDEPWDDEECFQVGSLDKMMDAMLSRV